MKKHILFISLALTLLNSFAKTQFNPEEMAKKFCKMVEGTNPFIAEEIMNENVPLFKTIGPLSGLGKCHGIKALISEEHILVLEGKFQNVPENIEFYITLDKEKKITNIIAVPGTKEGSSLKVEKIKMRDDVSIHSYTLVHQGEPRGTVYTRTPYSLTGNRLIGMKTYFDLGYNVVFQAMRGTYLSEGNFVWLDPKESEDAFDTIDWISSQDFSNGKVATIGTSYDGFGALAAGIDAHEDLKVVLSISSPTNILTDSLSAGGVLEGGMLAYLLDKSVTKKIPRLHEKIQYLINQGTPANEIDNLVLGDGENSIIWDALVRAVNENKNGFSGNGIFDRLVDIEVPTYHIAGNKSDQDSRDTILAFEEIEKNSKFKDNHFLMIGDWGHGLPKKQYYQLLSPILKKYLGSDELDFNFPRYTRFDKNLGILKAENSYVNRDQKFLEFLFTKENQMDENLKVIEESKAGQYVFSKDSLEFSLARGLIFRKVLNEDVETDGAGEVELNFEFTDCQMNINVLYWKMNKDNKVEMLSLPRLRESIDNEGVLVQKNISMYVENYKHKKGEKIFFTISDNSLGGTIPSLEKVIDPKCSMIMENKLTLDFSKRNGVNIPIKRKVPKGELEQGLLEL